MIHAINLASKIIPCHSKNPISPYPFVLIRGLARNMSYWLSFTEELSKYFHIVMIDLLGTGESRNFLGRASINDFAQDVIATLLNLKLKEKNLNFEKVNLLGMSLGGMVCLQIAESLELNKTKNKDKNTIGLNTIYVLGSSAKNTGERRIFIRALIKILFSICINSGHKLIASHLVSEEFLKSNPQIVKTWDDLWKKDSTSFIALIRQIFAAHHFSIQKLKKEFDAPIFFLASKDDKLVPYKNSEYLNKKYTSSSLILYDNFGHDFTTEKADFFASEIVRILVVSNPHSAD